MNKKIKRLKILIKYGIHLKPLYILRLGRNVLLMKYYHFFSIEKFVLRGVEFAPTFNCNFNCSHCLCAKLKEYGTREEIGLKDYKRVVKQAMKLGAISFGLSGGEPFVKENWEEIIKTFKPKQNHVLMSTNGWLFNEETAKKCKALGVDTINFSLDSSIAKIHDKFRKRKGSYDRVMKGMELCKKYGMNPVINTVVYKGNLYTNGFTKLLDFAEENNIFVSICFAKGVGNFSDKDVMLDDEDFKNYFKIVEPYSCVFVHHIDSEYNFGSRGCPGAKEFLSITPYGDVTNCANVHIYFGNIKEEKLNDIRDRALKETPFGKYSPCFMTMNKKFMKFYYQFMKNKNYVTVYDFKKEWDDYNELNTD